MRSDLTQRGFFGRLEPLPAVSCNSDHANSLDVRDQILEKAKPLCGQAFLAAHSIHHVTSGYPARPHIALSKACRDRVDSYGGKYQRDVGLQVLHSANRKGCGHKNPRFQRVQFSGQIRQQRIIAIRKTNLKDVVAAFDQPLILQAVTHCRHSSFEGFLGARIQHRHQRQLRVLLSPRLYRP